MVGIMELAGKRILITGGSLGNGFFTPEFAIREGASVCICARNTAPLDEAVAQIIARSPGTQERIHQVIMDVRDERSVQDAVSKARALLGGLDIVINNAGYAHPGYVERLPMEVY